MHCFRSCIVTRIVRFQIVMKMLHETKFMSDNPVTANVMIVHPGINIKYNLQSND